MKNPSGGKSLILLLLAAAAMHIPPASAEQAASGDWKVWGGDQRSATLDQINAKNVSQLKPAWIYDSGKFGRSWEDTPLLINGLLYVIDAGSSDVIALQPETGKQVWRHKAPEGKDRDQRALAYWGGDGKMKPRLLMTWGDSIYGIDPASGNSVTDGLKASTSCCSRSRAWWKATISAPGRYRVVRAARPARDWRPAMAAAPARRRRRSGSASRRSRQGRAGDLHKIS